MIAFHYETNRIYGTVDDKLVAEILFPNTGATADIVRTFVEDSLRGQGIASQLVERCCEVIKMNNWKVKASCSYAAEWLEKHPEYNFLMRLLA